MEPFKKEMTFDDSKRSVSEAGQLSGRLLKLLRESEYCTKQAAIAEKLSEKLNSDKITLSIIGQFKRGKSSLVNRILDDEIMPVGIVPVTAAATRVVYGEPKAEVIFSNGSRKSVVREELGDYINEQKNTGNKLKVDSVTIGSRSPVLEKGFEIVDTPGVGSFHINNTESAYSFMKESDAVIFLLSVDSPINQIEIDFLRSTKEFAAKLFFAVNKADTVGESDLESYVGYCKTILGQILSTDEEINIIPVSARTGYGIDRLIDEIEREVRTCSREILEASVERKLYDLIEQTQVQIQFYRQAMKLSFREMDKRFADIERVISSSIEKAESSVPPYETALNEAIMYLSKNISDVFSMPYSIPLYEIVPTQMTMSREDFLLRFENICDENREELKRVLMYREENAHTVVTTISKLNLLSQRIRVIKNRLKEILQID